MVICVNTYQVKHGQLHKLVSALASSRIEKTLREMKGNVCFHFSVPIEGKNILYLTDIWADDAAFQAHLSSPATQMWSKLKEKYVESSQVRKYDL